MRFIGFVVPLALVGGVVALLGWARRAGEEEPAIAEPRRISLVAEAIGYVGAILVVAGGGVAIGQRWSDLGDAGRIGIVGGMSAGFLALGWVARRSAEPAFKRVAAVAWLISTCGIGATTGLFAAWASSGRDTDNERIILTAVTSVTTVYAWLLWRIERRALQHVALFGSSLLLVIAAVSWTAAEPPGWAYASATWLLAAAWAAGAWVRVLAPRWVGVPLGAITALVAPTAIRADGGMYALGITTAIGVMAAAVLLRFTPGIAIGAIGLFAYVTGTVVRYAGDALGVPAALATTGALILVGAALVARLMKAAHAPTPGHDEHPGDQGSLPRAGGSLRGVG